MWIWQLRRHMCEFPCFDFTTIHSGKEDLKGHAFHGAFSRNVALESGKDFSSVRHLRRFKKKIWMARVFGD